MKKVFVVIIITTVAIILITNFLNLQTRSIKTTMILTSPSFENEGNIPNKFTCNGGDFNPELQIQNVPESAKSLALIVDDPDAPSGTFTHWAVWNINPKSSFVKEESIPPASVEGTTSFGRIGYGGPCPPPGKPHRYFFKLYALDVVIDLKEGANKLELEQAMKNRIIEETELIGIYKR